MEDIYDRTGHLDSESEMIGRRGEGGITDNN